MSVAIETKEESNVVLVKASDKLTKEDYEHFVPAIEAQIARGGKVRILFDMVDFHGWDTAALWEDTKFDVKHFNDIERLALVGDKSWEKWMARFCRPFTTAKIRYFDRADATTAREWLDER